MELRTQLHLYASPRALGPPSRRMVGSVLPIRAFALVAAASLAGCAGTPAERDNVRYASGAVPQRFDLVVTRKASTRYEIDGSPYTFDELVRRVRTARANAVLVEGVGTVADAICVSILGIESGRPVFFRGADDEPKTVSFAMDPLSTERLAQSCRQ